MLAWRLISLTGRHIRAARALLGWGQDDLATKAKVAARTIRRMEDFEGPIEARTDTLRRVAVTLQKAGVEFLNDDQPGVRLKKK
jgi:predicted transcriptional regulator